MKGEKKFIAKLGVMHPTMVAGATTLPTYDWGRANAPAGQPLRAAIHVPVTLAPGACARSRVRAPCSRRRVAWLYTS